MANYVISHAADLDGVASAALLHFWGLMLSDDTHVAFADYDNAEDVIMKSVRDAGKNDTLAIADISLRDPSLLSRIAAHMPREAITIFDHHASSRDCWEAWRAEGVNIHFNDAHTHCTADLIYNAMIDTLGIPVPSDISALRQAAHSRDLWIRNDKNGEMMSDVITVLGAYHVFDELSANPGRIYPDNYTPVMCDALHKCQDNRERSKQMAKRSGSYQGMEINDGQLVKVVTAFCEGHESDISEMLMAPYSIPCWVGLINIKKNVLSFRCNSFTVNSTGVAVSDIATFFGGGGHPFAAGSPMVSHYADGLDPKALGLMMQALIHMIRNRAECAEEVKL